MHALATPLVAAASVSLAASAPAGSARTSVAVYAAASVLLFGASACYHRGRWSPRARAIWRRLDHGNIYLLIAGTYTPVATLGLSGFARPAVLWVIWCGAALGVSFRWLWPGAPRPLYTALYVVLGWSLLPALGVLLHDAGASVLGLALAGGACYTAGGAVYGLRRPDPSPRWFGFHEVFHALTLAGWGLQFAAVALLVSRAS